MIELKAPSIKWKMVVQVKFRLINNEVKCRHFSLFWTLKYLENENIEEQWTKTNLVLHVLYGYIPVSSNVSRIAAILKAISGMRRFPI